MVGSVVGGVVGGVVVGGVGVLSVGDSEGGMVEAGGIDSSAGGVDIVSSVVRQAPRASVARTSIEAVRSGVMFMVGLVLCAPWRGEHAPARMKSTRHAAAELRGPDSWQRGHVAATSARLR